MKTKYIVPLTAIIISGLPAGATVVEAKINEGNLEITYDHHSKRYQDHVELEEVIGDDEAAPEVTATPSARETVQREELTGPGVAGDTPALPENVTQLPAPAAETAPAPAPTVTEAKPEAKAPAAAAPKTKAEAKAAAPAKANRPNLRAGR